MTTENSRNLLRAATGIAAALAVTLAVRSMAALSPLELGMDSFVLGVLVRIAAVAFAGSVLAFCVAGAWERSPEPQRLTEAPTSGRALPRASAPSAI